MKAGPVTTLGTIASLVSNGYSVVAIPLKAGPVYDSDYTLFGKGLEEYVYVAIPLESGSSYDTKGEI